MEERLQIVSTELPTMTSATKLMKIPHRKQSIEHRAFGTSPISEASDDAVDRRVDLDGTRRMRCLPELLEHVYGCKACLAASIGGACGSPFCHQRPDHKAVQSRI